jgi:hypothetical protein
MNKEVFSASRIWSAPLKWKGFKLEDSDEKRGFSISKIRKMTPKSDRGSTSDEKRFSTIENALPKRKKRQAENLWRNNMGIRCKPKHRPCTHQTPSARSVHTKANH